MWFFFLLIVVRSSSWLPLSIQNTRDLSHSLLDFPFQCIGREVFFLSRSFCLVFRRRLCGSHGRIHLIFIKSAYYYYGNQIDAAFAHSFSLFLSLFCPFLSFSLSFLPFLSFFVSFPSFFISSFSQTARFFVCFYSGGFVAVSLSIHDTKKEADQPIALHFNWHFYENKRCKIYLNRVNFYIYLGKLFSIFSAFWLRPNILDLKRI